MIRISIEEIQNGLIVCVNYSYYYCKSKGEAIQKVKEALGTED